MSSPGEYIVDDFKVGDRVQLNEGSEGVITNIDYISKIAYAKVDGKEVTAAVHFKYLKKIETPKSVPHSAFSNDPHERKRHPIMTGLLDYFPDACAAVAEISLVGNEQHHPGQPLHWERGKSGDHADTAVRHLMDRGLIDSDGKRHSAKAAWRALANLQEEIEREKGLNFSRGSK